MRVLMANKYLYARAGAETYMLSVAAELRARGHEIAFFGMAHPENTKLGTVCACPALEFGVRQSRLSTLKNIARAGVSAVLGSVQRRLDRFIAEFKPDVIHAHNIYNQLSPALFIKHTPHTPVLMTVHDYKPVCPNYSLFTEGAGCTRCLEKNFSECITHRCVQGSLMKSTLAAASSALHKTRATYSRGYHMLIAPSRFMKRQLIAGGLPTEHVTVLNNFAALPTEFSAPGKNLLYIGRLCREKGVHTLIEAYAAMSGTRPPLRIAGEGPLGAELKAFAAQKGLSEIQWLGRISPQAVAAELDACAFSVVPSIWYENCSMAILESLARGRAVVASDSGGNPELIEAGVDGEIFRAGDAHNLRESLEKVFRTECAPRMGMAARAAAFERFGPESHVANLLELYSTVSSSFRQAIPLRAGGLA